MAPQLPVVQPPPPNLSVTSSPNEGIESGVTAIGNSGFPWSAL